ncbi:MAG: RcnB family protein [Brevundimonas sp.]
MNKFATVALAATLALGTVGAAGAAEAQSRRDAREWRQDQREDRRELRQDRREFRQEQRQDRREFRQEVRQYERWQRAQRRYSAPRYVPPRGYYARSWGYGQALPPAYRGRQYVVYDYNRYGLRAPPRGYHYVRTGDDVVLAAVATGVITAVIAGLFN